MHSKYRVIVWVAKKDSICLTARARAEGDRRVCAAPARELLKHGAPVRPQRPACWLLNRLGVDKVCDGHVQVAAVWRASMAHLVPSPAVQMQGLPE